MFCFKIFANMLHAPLEQFQILQLIPLNFYIFDFSFTNFFLINLIVLFYLKSILYFISHLDKSSEKIYLFVVPNSWQVIIEYMSEIVSQLISDIISTKNEKYLPIISILFSFILLNNLIGLIPYSFTVTSHLIVTFTLAFSIFIGINIITFKLHGFKTFSLFLPSNTTFFLALLLVPIEFISYIAKPISLGVRLFINLMAGHSLLKVIIGFSWNMLLSESVISIGLVFPMFILIILFGLELGVALIQTYVFTILVCIYFTELNIS